MLAWLEQFLIRYPELALFLVIAAGYWIGSFRIGAFSLGPVTAALFAGLFVGQFAHVPVSGMTKSFLFLLFLFGIGYSAPPARRLDRVADGDGRDGRRSGALGKPGRGAGLYAGLSGRQHPAHDMGYHHRSHRRRLKQPMPLPGLSK
jgi:hypothetical protein